jgi:ubiquinone/menaquinone biosynthesis C-methylase UbiE
VPDLFEIYRKQPRKYEQLVSREDWQGNLLPAVERISALDGAEVVELGAGTGRLTRLLAARVRFISAFDASSTMLEVAAELLGRDGRTNWRTTIADHRCLPVTDGSADLVIAGWTISSIPAAEKTLEPGVGQALAEMRRVLKPGGRAIVIETLGTGWPAPHAPELLEPYYDYLEKRGFRRSWIRTDYRFRDWAEARDLTAFFFGEDPLGALVEGHGGVILPECTGLWWIART